MATGDVHVYVLYLRNCFIYQVKMIESCDTEAKMSLRMFFYERSDVKGVLRASRRLSNIRHRAERGGKELPADEYVPNLDEKAFCELIIYDPIVIAMFKH